MNFLASLAEFAISYREWKKKKKKKEKASNILQGLAE